MRDCGLSSSGIALVGAAAHGHVQTETLWSLAERPLSPLCCRRKVSPGRPDVG